MNKNIYNYPKTFCNSVKCDKNNYVLENTGIPTNMSVYNCNFPEKLDCVLQDSNSLIRIRNDTEPMDKVGYNFINPQVYSEKYATEFQGFNCDSKNSKEIIPLPNGWLEPGNGKQVFTNDPRLNSASHAQWITLDQPPIDSSMKLYDIPNDKRLDNYGQNYRTYSDINAGQILYYINKSLDDPISRPVFVNSSNIYSYVYVTPMGGLYPSYVRKPLKDDNFIAPTRNNYEGGLSWIQDSSEQRENITFSQIAPFLERDWSMRYAK